MRVLVTGASGHIGSAVVPELLQAGHDVVGLARSDNSAAILTAAGVQVQRGDLDDLDTLAGSAAEADGVIHLAFKHEAMRSGDMETAVTADQRAIEAMSEALVGTGKPLVIASGTLLLSLLGLGRTATEADALETGPRIDAENAVVALAGRGVRSSVVRLPPTVHSSLDHHGFVPTLIASARDKGASAYVGAGDNRWPAGHTLDVARLFRLALEAAPAGSRLHAVGDEGIPFRQIAEAIGHHAGVPALSVAPEEADAYLGFLSFFAQLDNPTSSEITQKLMDWEPAHPGLIEDLGEGHYFASPAGS